MMQPLRKTTGSGLTTASIKPHPPARRGLSTASASAHCIKEENGDSQLRMKSRGLCLPASRVPPTGTSSQMTIVIGYEDGRNTQTATTTLDADAGPEPSDGGLPPGGAPPACSSVRGKANLPSGTLPATLTGNKLGASWSMSADFTGNPADPAICGPCGEYRQYVRGTFTKNGATVQHKLCGGNLDPDTFQEDCAQIGGTQYKYGYHSIAFPTSKFSRPDQATGQRWDGYDAPGISGSSGDKLGVSLDFQGSLVDTCNGVSLGGSQWSVAGTATVP